MGIFGSKRTQPAAPSGTALEQAATQGDARSAGAANELVARLLDVGIDGRGPFASAHRVADEAMKGASSDEAAINALVRRHAVEAGVGGFVTGIGGFVTLLVALPVNVLEFYLLATRMVAAIARVRGYDIDRPQIRTAVLLTLVGADADDLLRKAGVATSVGVGERLTNLAAQRLPAPALMVLNKGVGFRLLTRAGRSVFGRLGRGVPIAGGAVGAGLDVYLLSRIAAGARREFPRQG